MSHAPRPYLAGGVAIVVATLVAVPPLPVTAPDAQTRAVHLTGVDGPDSPLGDGTALMMGATSFPTPSQGWMNAFDALYLQPRGFGGTMQALTTPESLYSLTGPFSQTLNASLAQGVRNVLDGVQGQSADAANPIVITGYSQGSGVAALSMTALANHDVPSDNVHYVLVGDPNIPNGGYLERFDLPAGTHPTAPHMGVTFNGAEPSDLYPTDVYTLEYDGFADFPQYPINFLADLNAYLGIAFNHLQYLGLTPEQVGGAMRLPTSAADTLTNYYMIPSESLPLLDPLRLAPFLGNPLADLVQPDLRVLVDLGYGSVTDGWSTGDADTPTPVGFFPPTSVLEQVPQALGHGLVQGFTDAIKDLTRPDNYQLISPETMTAFLGPLLRSAQAAFFWPGATPTEIIDNIKTWVSENLDNVKTGLPEVSFTHTGIPPIDVASTFLTTIPEIDLKVFEAELAAGNPLDAIGIPIAADLGVTPLLLVMALS